MTDVIERTLELRASLDVVWRALTDPAELSRWFGEEAQLDLRPGGEGWFGWPEHGRFAARVELVEPLNRLTWRWARDRDTAVDDGPSTLVEWTLEPRPDGGTLLSLRESGFEDDASFRENDAGWTEELAELEAYLGPVPAPAPAPVH